MIDAFTGQRPRLFGIAYRMLGSVAEAEDAVQETYLRWHQQSAGSIDDPAAWLVTAVTRWCIDELRSARRRREDYVGTWLPEPLVDGSVPAPDRAAALSDSLSLAFLVLLETLEPIERAVFLLREVFDYDYAEIARIVEKSEANCRQIVSRAKARLRQRPDSPAKPSVNADAVVQRFVAACRTGNVRELLATLTADAVLYGDGGGKVRSVLRPIVTADRISRFFAGIHEQAFGGAEIVPMRVNGDRGLWIRQRNGTVYVMAFALAGDRIRAIFSVSNPDKLRHVRPPDENAGSRGL